MSPMHKAIDFRNQPPAPRIPGLYDTSEVAGIFGWRSRQMVSRVARSEKWASQKAHKHPTLFKAEDVLRYWEARRRTEMLYKTGLTAVGLLRAARPDEADIACPVCGAYAYSTRAGTACVNNHRRRKPK
jgi:hypothetical protein